jgi:hypothetical protein
MGQHTIKIGGPDERNVNAEVAVVRRAVKAEVDAEWYGSPCRVLLAAIEADLCIDGQYFGPRSGQ